MVVCLYKFRARDSGLNNWEHRGEDMYCPRALLKIPGSGTTFFFALRTPPAESPPEPRSQSVGVLGVLSIEPLWGGGGAS